MDEIRRLKLIPWVGPDQRTPEWYEIRKRVFGSSSAAALCGMSQYRTPRHVYEEHVNPSGEQQEENEAMRNGRYFEPAILGIYSEETQTKVVHPLPMYIHPLLKHIAASLDGRREDGRVVEAKWSMSPAVAEQLGEEESDFIPNEWLFQAQQQMDVVDEEVADIAVMLFGRLKIYTVRRNDDLIEQIHSAAEEMLQRIENFDPPEPTWTHPGTLALVKRIYKDVDVGSIVELPAEITAVQREYRELSLQKATIEGRLQELDARRREAMGDAEVGILEGDEHTLKRVAIADSLVTSDDVAALQARIGQLARKGYVRIYDLKPKKRRPA